MTADPTIEQAVSGSKIKASSYNTNFTNMINYIKACVTDMLTTITSFIPSQTGNTGKYLRTNGTSAYWFEDLSNTNIPAGTLSSGAYQLTNRRVHTATITGNCTISMPTSTSEIDYAFLYFSTTNASYPTFSVSGWNCSNSAPSFSTTKKNFVKLYRNPIDNLWYAEYSQLGA